MTDFTGFDRKLTRFLKELSENNDRDWFNANKARFTAEVQGPALDFVRAVGPRLKAVSRHLVADDRKSGGSMMRIYRDTRFSKDKRPYNEHVSFHFQPDAPKGTDVPGLYLRIEPRSATLGTGLWQPQTPALTKIREAIAKNPKAWFKVRDDAAFRDCWGALEDGDMLKRPPRGFDAESPAVDDLRRKSYVAFAKLKTAELRSDDLVETVIARWKASKPLLRYICKSLGLAF